MENYFENSILFLTPYAPSYRYFLWWLMLELTMKNCSKTLCVSVSSSNLQYAVQKTAIMIIYNVNMVLVQYISEEIEVEL